MRASARAERALHRRISDAPVGPLLDRIDLHIEVPAVTAADLILPPQKEAARSRNG
jgi:predicted ATPase with chaperone activity